MAPSQRSPLADLPKLWENARASLARKDFENPYRIASEAYKHCEAEGVRYGQASAALVLALVELGKGSPYGSDLLALLAELGLEWGEVAQLFLCSSTTVSQSSSPAAALDAATAAVASAGSDKWASVTALSLATWASLLKEGPADARERMELALKLARGVGLDWSEEGSLGPTSAIRSVPRRTEAEAEEALNAAEKAPAGKARGEAMLRAAGASLQRGKAEPALQSAREALAQFRELGAQELEATALRMMASAHGADGAVLEALTAAGKAAALFRELGHKRGEASSLVVAAGAMVSKYSTEEASWKASEALRFFRQLGCRKEEAQAQEVLARCSIWEEDFSKALELATRSMDLAEALGDSLKQGLRLCLVSQVQTALGNEETAVQSAVGALAKVTQLGDTAAQLEAFDALSASCRGGDRLGEALTALQEAEQGFRQAGRDSDTAKLLLRIAELHGLDGEQEEGVAAAREAGSLLLAQGDKAGSVEAQVRVAQLYWDLGDPQRAYSSAGEAISSAHDLGKPGLPGYMAALELLITINNDGSWFDEATLQAKQALKHFNSLREKKYEARAMLLAASVELKQKKLDTALTMLQQVPALFLAVGDKRGEAAAWLQIAKLHLERKEPDLAVKAAEEAQVAFRKLGNRAGKVEACHLVAESNFLLVPQGLGSARDAVSAAQEILSAAQASKDKNAEAAALNTLANAHLMARSFGEAKKIAFQAEELCMQVGDNHGAASAYLLSAGAHLGEGRFEEARKAAMDAREGFSQCGDIASEDNAEHFTRQINEYRAGQLSRLDFCGFCVAMPEDAAKQRRKRPMGESKANVNIQNLELFSVGANGKREPTFIFDGVETRGARQVRPSSNSEALEVSQPRQPAKREQVLYTVRWVKSSATPSNKRDTSPSETERRKGLSMQLPAPGSGTYTDGVASQSNLMCSAPTKRLFHTYAGDKGV